MTEENFLLKSYFEIHVLCKMVAGMAIVHTRKIMA